MVCPFAWDVPGGVQAHVRDLAEELIRLGHEVSVLAPGTDETPHQPWVVVAGRAVPVPNNGSVARVAFGPVSASRTRRWVREGDFDVLHVHSPYSPSLGMLACWAARGPIVATFHASVGRSWMLAAAYGILQATLEKISARIAVSEEARRTVVEHVGGDAILIPNGVSVRRYRTGEPLAGWPGEGGTLGFLGRLDEPRKGLPVLLEAFPAIVERHPGARLLVAGPGDADDARELLPAGLRDHATFLGLVSEADKVRMLHSLDFYVAPNTGQESFGIVLLEAMAAGTPVLASDIAAFRAVLDGGAAGALFPPGDPAGLAAAAGDLLADRPRLASLATAGAAVAHRYDWETVARQVLDVYETVAIPGVKVVEDDRQGPGLFAGRLRREEG